jgi:hypothetical protein
MPYHSQLRGILDGIVPGVEHMVAGSTRLRVGVCLKGAGVLIQSWLRAFLSESKDRGEYQVNYRKTSFYWNYNRRNWDFGVSPYFGRLTTSIPSYRQELVNRFYQKDEAFPGAYSDWYSGL